MNKILIKTTYAIRALRNIWSVYLGECVTIYGNEYVVNNGVKRRNGKILWDCIALPLSPNLASIEATQNEMRRKPTAWVGAFRSLYQFYMRYWYHIDVLHRSTSTSKRLVG